MNICIKNLTFRFGKRLLFDNFSLSFGGADENPLLILGPSGCGKTTLLRLIAGLLVPEDAASITVPPAAAGAAAALAANVSFVFQEPRLLSHLSALENVALPLENLLGKKAARERARRFLRLCAVEELAERFPRALSGGQQHRVALARAWAYPAPLILMDEPFQSLDIPLRIQLMDEVRALLKTEDRFVVAVTHAPREALYLGRRVIALGTGDRDGAEGGSKIVFDERFTLPPESREFVSEKTVDAEKRIIAALASA